MTTRPSVGSQRPSSSSAGSLQRPSQPHRSLSQQFSSSPTRRGNEGFADSALEGDAALSRHGPRIGISRLRVEMSKDSKGSDVVESPKPGSATGTPRPYTPRGRPKLHFNEKNEAAIKPMPLPVRPGQHAPSTSEKVRAAPGNTLKKDARPKPYVLEVPAAAPHYPPNGRADFFPWTGNHIEDQFSDNVIRHGYYDKAQMTQNETGSARTSIFPALKHKSGLQTLSSLFTSILTQRRAHGQIVSASTFKPPPRVTVTDTKREMWLKDLANPTISLRRLSRSIPHGIRGKVLLDQSLGKNIPIERAVWLAKCVGANELRSFRRKGVSGTFAMGGEAKWIRDFTVCVEQFVESILSTCGEKDFKARISYAIRLATHFHAEHLLDREHYMDWLASSLENSTQAKLPLWLLITQVYWKDLLRYRKYGRRLSAALLNHLAEISSHPDQDILAPLSDRLKLLIKGLMGSHPDSFVAPKMWAKHRDFIMSNLGQNDDRFLVILGVIDRRNSRLTAQGVEKELSNRRRVIQLLDGTLSKPFSNELVTQCWEMDDEKEMLISAVLEWSTSSHRPGATKTFVAARILRSWSKLGADITGAILSFLDSAVSNPGRSKDAFYHLVSELARSEHFSTSRYLQWLIARGGLYDATDTAPDGPCATRLLAELPTHNLSDSIADLRATLLSRADFAVDEEEDRTRSYMASMNRSLPGMQASVDLELDSQDLMAQDLSLLLSEVSRTSKSELGLWLRQKVRIQMVQPTIPPLDDWDDSPMKGGTSAITTSDFNTVRQYLELMEDYSMLADILKIITSSNDAEVLASCADTLDLHLETFAAIGALKSLFDTLMGRLRSLTEDVDSVPRVLLVSLLDLASRLPEQKIIAQHLAQELALSDRKTAADACSPISDHMLLTQTVEVDFTDEIEKILASGNSMDQATLQRLFQKIVLQLEASWEKSPEQQRSCGLLLTRLRTFDPTQFDILIVSWVNRLLQMKSRPRMIDAFGPLISFGCLTLHDVISCVPTADSKSASDGLKSSSTARDALALLLPPSDLSQVMTAKEAYRLRIKQAHLARDYPMDALSTIRRAFEDSHLITDFDIQPMADSKSSVQSRPMQELLQSLVLSNTQSFNEKLVIPLLLSPNADVVAAINEAVDRLLLGSDSDGPITTEILLNLADDFSLPFCQVKLASMFKSEDVTMGGTEEGPSESLEAFDNAIESAVTAGKTSWASIVPLLDISIARHLRQRAETRFLALFPSPKTITEDEQSSSHSQITYVENILHIIDATAYSIPVSPIPDTAPTTLAANIVSTLNGIWLLLANSQSSEIKDSITAKWLPLLLSFMTLHTSAFETAKPGSDSRAKAILALSAIFLELQALESSTDDIKSLIEQTFDLALHLVDNLPDDARQQCIRSVREVSSPRICYLLSFATNPTDCLVLSQKEKAPNIPGMGAGEKPVEKERLAPFPLRRWEMLGEPTPNVGENDTSLSMTLFGARRG